MTDDAIDTLRLRLAGDAAGTGNDDSREEEREVENIGPVDIDGPIVSAATSAGAAEASPVEFRPWMLEQPD
jgi:hypothetical protein